MGPYFLDAVSDTLARAAQRVALAGSVTNLRLTPTVNVFPSTAFDRTIAPTLAYTAVHLLFSALFLTNCHEKCRHDMPGSQRVKRGQSSASRPKLCSPYVMQHFSTKIGNRHRGKHLQSDFIPDHVQQQQTRKHSKPPLLPLIDRKQEEK